MSYSIDSLKLVALDLNGASIALPQPIEFELVKSYDSPAHSFEVIVPWEREYPELYRVTLTAGSKRMFTGLIDEQVSTENDEGRRLKLIARSKGALLLDNEAKPQLYKNISMQTIFNNHVRPYGFDSIASESNPMFNEYLVSKGMSEWEVLYNFYQSSSRGNIMIDDDDVIHCWRNPPHEKILVISNKKPEAEAKFSNVKIVNNRYAPTSRYLVRDHAGAYSYTFNNPDTEDYRLFRTRYLNPAVQFTVSDNGGLAEAQLRTRQSMGSKQVITVNCPGLVEVKVCDRADVNGGAFDIYARFVHQVRYALTASGPETTLTLVNYRYV